jgi:hypothetical protein
MCLGFCGLGYIVGVADHRVPATASGYSSEYSPPDFLLIDGERWSVQAYDFDSDKNVQGKNGLSSCPERRIWYDSGIKTQGERRTVLWHEIFHAFYCYQGSRMDANWAAATHDNAEHEIVYEAGMFLPGFVHDNPEFMKWAEDWK